MFNYDKLSQAIVRSGKSKAYLCRKIGKPEYYLRDVIKQKNKISEENQAILAAELGVTVAYLNDAEQKEKPTGSADGQLPHAGRREILASEGVRILLDADAKVTDEQLEDIIDFIKFQQRKNGR